MKKSNKHNIRTCKVCRAYGVILFCGVLFISAKHVTRGKFQQGDCIVYGDLESWEEQPIKKIKQVGRKAHRQAGSRSSVHHFPFISSKQFAHGVGSNRRILPSILL